jgi:plasmid stabilization system protein ParE
MQGIRYPTRKCGIGSVHGKTKLDFRILLYGHYRITYLIKSEEDIDILGVFHGALNIQRYLI